VTAEDDRLLERLVERNCPYNGKTGVLQPYRRAIVGALPLRRGQWNHLEEWIENVRRAVTATVDRVKLRLTPLKKRTGSASTDDRQPHPARCAPTVAPA
jgi:hypothetical protein